jgi:hypothetical protein
MKEEMAPEAERLRKKTKQRRNGRQQKLIQARMVDEAGRIGIGDRGHAGPWFGFVI